MSRTNEINWLNAPAVPVKVIQMKAAGQVPLGQIIEGPMGQKTYVGPIRSTPQPGNEWREGLKAV